MKNYKIKVNNKQFIVKAQDKIDAVKKLKDSLWSHQQENLRQGMKSIASYPQSKSYSIEDFKTDIKRGAIGRDIRKITSSQEGWNPEKYLVTIYIYGNTNNSTYMHVTFYRTTSRTNVVIDMWDENGTRVLYGTKPTHDSVIRDKYV